MTSSKLDTAFTVNPRRLFKQVPNPLQIGFEVSLPLFSVRPALNLAGLTPQVVGYESQNSIF
jgi:hypothetical protein